MKIEVVYACEQAQYNIPLELPSESTLLQAISASNILTSCPEIDLQQQKVGIWGVIVPLETVLKNYDRVEIYRPLPVDPITKRFDRVKKERKKCT